LSFSEDEIANLDLRSSDGKVLWNTAADPNKDITIGERALDLVTEALKQLNEKKKLTQQHFNLYESFVENRK
jgi:hypothetical protein